MGILQQNLSLPTRPGLYAPKHNKANKTLIIGNNALAKSQVLKHLQKSGVKINVLCVDTYGLEPDRAALKNLFAPKRIGDVLHHLGGSRSRPTELLLLFGSPLASSERHIFERGMPWKVQFATTIQEVTSDAALPAQAAKGDYALDTPAGFEATSLSFSQRLRLSLASALLMSVVAGVFLILFQLWSLWPMMLVIVSLGTLLPAVYEILPFPWGVLRGMVWGGIFAALWYGMSQFVLLLPLEMARHWALVVLAVGTWIGRGIYRPWRSLTWENAVGLGVCIAAAVVAYLW